MELPKHGEDSEIVMELEKKLRLIDKIKKQTEEQARSHSKSKLPYAKAATFIVEHASLPYSELLREVTAILLSEAKTFLSHYK